MCACDTIYAKSLEITTEREEDYLSFMIEHLFDVDLVQHTSTCVHHILCIQILCYCTKSE